MEFRVGDRVEVISSTNPSLIGKLGVIVYIWDQDQNCDVELDDTTIPSDLLTGGSGKYTGVRGFALRRLRKIEEDEVAVTELELLEIISKR